jgi:Zn-dependent M28 family amino/carboxypeptidase
MKARKPGLQPRWIARIVLLALVVVGLVALFVLKDSDATPPAKSSPPEPVVKAAVSEAGVQAAAPALVPRIDSARAMKYVREVVGFGPRPPGSPAHRKLEVYIKSHLQDGDVEDDAFTAATPVGPIRMRNVIAKFPGAKPGIIVIGTHYETALPIKNFVGANDGGSGTGLLLELANQLRGWKRNGYSVWLVWIDGEEAIRQWSPTDSLYGSRHLVEKWQKDGTLKQIKAFLLADMVGDANLHIERDVSSTPWLIDLVQEAATGLGLQSHFFQRQVGVEDDHMPFVRAGVPAVDLIDFDYGYNNVYHHTPADTLDKLSPRSLEVVGNVLLESVRLLDAR